MFDGTQKSDSGTLLMDSHFACYPAHDPELERAQASMCYEATAGPPERSSEAVHEKGSDE